MTVCPEAFRDRFLAPIGKRARVIVSDTSFWANGPIAFSRGSRDGASVVEVDDGDGVVHFFSEGGFVLGDGETVAAE